MAEPPSVLYAVCLEYTCDWRKVDLGLKCWRWSRANDNELIFWELRRFVHALFHGEQKHVLPSRLILRLMTEWAKLFRSRGWFWDDVFVESSQRCRATEGAVKIQVRAEFAVQTKAALAILVQGVVLRHRKRARATARPMLCGFLKCSCTVESLSAGGGTPEYHVDACDAHRRLGMDRSIFVDLVETLSLAIERDCASAMKKEPPVLTPVSTGKARLRLCEDMKRKYTHTLVMQRKLATGADLLRTNDDQQMARTLYSTWVRQRMRPIQWRHVVTRRRRGQGRPHWHRRPQSLG